ncbi:cytochrome c oxidase cbb3-type subunit 3 [Chromatocurvus halotolerans]|uniref:Cytochrome c oxidase cbb3-type subunit 3 n=1 Tax=Chromatocurvus halotolerans TaxID=1132028 RepID=A0A4R2KPB3_9GAMM|nr:cytochrome c oxidase cbb3-type subunit 3 [Chromatocurvus halotolerans]
MRLTAYLRAGLLVAATGVLSAVQAAEDRLDATQIAEAEVLYQQYCALCHGDDRAGYQADHAPSLKSQSLLSTGYPRFMYTTVAYGRANTAMEGYSTEMGGPLDRAQIRLLLRWLVETEEVERVALDHDAVIAGDAQQGKMLYAQHCASCHGADGQGITAPSLGDPALLANAPDAFLKYAIVNGRDGTPMASFSDQLKDGEINSVVAFLRSQAAGWKPEPPTLVEPPAPEDYVLNPEGETPRFTLRDGRYVPAAEVVRALEEKRRFILLDTRPASAWQRSHIPGAVPMPYYREGDRAGENLPNDGTWIVAYCACPHAASDFVINNLQKLGYRNTAVIDEGILVWTAMGLPVTAGAMR